jgi:flagellar hook-length control protein FliK
MAATRARQGITIRLNPEDLGTISMTVRSLGGAIDAQMSASHDHVRTALEQHRPYLVQQLEQRGLTLGSLTIQSPNFEPASSSNSAMNDPASSFASQNRERESNASSNPHWTRTANDSTQSPTTAWTLSTAGIDLWI